MVNQYVTKIHRQHTSVVTSLPKAVREQLELTAGDNLFWEVDEASQFVQVCKVVRRGELNAANKRNSDRKDQGGST